MAKCDEGYLCDVCGKDVAEIWESRLYLAYVVGRLEAERLHVAKERHIRCEPTLAQFIIDPRFEPIAVEGDFDKRGLDPAYVRSEEELLSRGWKRLFEIASASEELSMLDYPLPEVRARMEREGNF